MFDPTVIIHTNARHDRRVSTIIVPYVIKYISIFLYLTEYKTNFILSFMHKL